MDATSFIAGASPWFLWDFILPIVLGSHYDFIHVIPFDWGSQLCSTYLIFYGASAQTDLHCINYQRAVTLVQ